MLALVLVLVVAALMLGGGLVLVVTKQRRAEPLELRRIKRHLDAIFDEAAHAMMDAVAASDHQPQAFDIRKG